MHVSRSSCRPVGAFTVPELLAVIAVTAILLSLLMPNLTKARVHALTAACLSNQRQLVIAWRGYALEHRSRVVESWQGNGGFATGTGTHWYVALKPHYDRNKKLVACPAADRRVTPVGAGGNRGTAEDGWKVGSDATVHAGVGTDDYGGYGLNNWLEDQATVGTGVGGSRPNGNFIDKLTVNVPHNQVPVLGDGVWADNGWPRESDTVPANFQDPEITAAVGWMKRYCLDRHIQAVNLSFMDCSARTVRIADLWKLKWHRTYVQP